MFLVFDIFYKNLDYSVSGTLLKFGSQQSFLFNKNKSNN